MSKMTKNNDRKGERGNVLFLILIAVALFAALSYAVTSSSRSGGGDAGGETSLISSAQITQYPASVRTAIIRMLVRGVTVEQLLFNAPGTFVADVNTDALREVAVFHPSGGGATYVTAPPDVMEDGAQGEWFFSSLYEIADVGTSNITAAANNLGNDVIAFLPGVKQSICIKLNEELGITGGTDGDSDGVPIGPTAIPTIAENMDTDNDGIGAAAPGTTHEIVGVFAGQAFGCYDADDGDDSVDAGNFVYYHVLVER